MKNISSQKKRILQFIDFKRISKSEFYRETGISNGILDKSSGLSMDTIEKFYSKYPEINPEWLLTGNGSMFKESGHAPGLSEPGELYAIDDDAAAIPLIPLSAMAGFGTIDTTILEVECEKYVIPMFKGADFLIQVKGNSMQPRYNSGDVVACKRLSVQDIFFQWGKVYVLDTDQGALVKRIKKGSDDNHIQVISDNAEYDPFELHLGKLNAIAIVMGVIRLV